jgi:hypothetical protein
MCVGPDNQISVYNLKLFMDSNIKVLKFCTELDTGNMLLLQFNSIQFILFISQLSIFNPSIKNILVRTASYKAKRKKKNIYIYIYIYIYIHTHTHTHTI